MTIQTLHLRSSVQGKEPVAGSATGQLPVGSIAINYNKDEPFLSIQDSAGAIRRIAGIKVGATAPVTPTAGEAWLDITVPTKPVFKVFDGTAWQGAGSGVSTGAAAPAAPAAGDLWVDTTSAAAPVLKVYNGTAFVAVTPDATTSAKGVVQLADAAAVTAGTAGRVVTADQLKATNDAMATAIGGGITSLSGATPISVTGTGNSRTIAVGDATASAKGIVQLADAAAITAGTAGRVVDAAQLKAHTPPDATEAIRGIAEIATQGEVNAGTDDERFVTPKKLSAFVTEQLKATWLPSNSINASDEGVSTWNGPADTLTATPSVEVSINGGAYGTGGPVTTGQTVKVRWQAAAVTAGAHDATLTGRVVNAAGNVAVDYTLKLDKLPDAITIAPQTNVALGAAVDSAASTAITGLNAPARIWLGTTDGTNPQISIGGGAWAAVPATAAAGVAIVQGQTFRLRHTTKGNVSEVTTTTVRVGWDTASSVAVSYVTTNTAVLPALRFGWNADTDAYTRDPAANRIIDTQVGIRRCVLTNAGVVAYYLDADDSTKRAGDWLRLVETTELSTPYTGTHGAPVANTALRGSAPAWAAGTYTKGQRVQQGGSVWECIAATTTATPAAGATAADLTGGAGQVMVEIPVFSVWHETAAAGSHTQHTFHLQKGVKTDGGYAVHPAFVKPDGSNRSFIYVGAYQGTGTNGNGSASGVNNTTNMTRAACRTACAGRGAGWHQLGYWEYSALQWLLFTEYQDMNSQKVLGNGAMEGSAYVVNTGLSNGRGNRSENKYTSGGSGADYVSYRGVENFYGRSWQWVDGININNLVPYLCADPSKWADDTATGYTSQTAVPSGSGDFIRDVASGLALLPASVTGGSGTTFTGDALWTGSGWLVASVGGDANGGAPVGALYASLSRDSTRAGAGIGGRLAYAP